MDHSDKTHRILILGAGFGGIYTALKLEHRRRGRSDIRIMMVDRHDSFLYTPLLPALATGGLEPRHVSHSLASIFKNTSVEFLSHEVAGIDLVNKRVSVGDHAVSYETLVVALGSEPDFHGEEEQFPEVFTLTTAYDAVRINNHLIRMFEKAAWEENPIKKRACLSFTVVGGGPTGVEIAGEIFDYCRKTLRPDFKARIRQEEIHVCLLERHNRVLRSLPERLSRSAEERMRRLGIELSFDAHPISYANEVLHLGNGGDIDTATVVWASGTRPSKAVRELQIRKDPKGRIIVKATLEVPDYPGVWVIGDNASCVDRSTEEPYPETAQIAVHEAQAVADNILSGLAGEPARDFSYRDRGEIVPIGDNFALYAAKKFTTGGRPAWFLWNLVHIFKLPIWHCRFYLTVGLVLKTFFGRSGTPLESKP